MLARAIAAPHAGFRCRSPCVTAHHSAVPTPAERRALLFVAAVAALGVGVRGMRALGDSGPPTSDRQSLAQQIAAVDSAIATGGRRKPATVTTPRRPTAASPAPAKVLAEKKAPSPSRSSKKQAPAPASIDMDRATEEELTRLPGVGPSLAARIVADRAARGPFGSIDGFQRVKGVGPSLAQRVQPYVTFSLPPRLSDTEMTPPGSRRRP